MAKKAYIGAKMLGNLLFNGQFSDESIGFRGAWNPMSYDSAHVKYGPTAMKLTGKTGEFETTVSSTASIQLTPSHKYYVCIEAYQTTVSGSVDIYWPIAEPVMLSGQVLPKANQWCRISTVADRGAFSAGTYPIRFDYNNQNQAGTMWFDGAMLIDLTAAFGSGKEPTKEWCDAHIQFTAGGQVCCFDTANSAARQIKNMYIGVDDKARKVKKAYIGVGGKARLCYTSTLPPAIVDLWSSTNSLTNITCAAYGNGYWVVGGTYYDGSNRCARIGYTKNLDGEWTFVDIWKDTRSGNEPRINCITYANGKWVVGGCFYGGSNWYARIAYASSPAGSWTTKDIWGGNSTTVAIKCITYANGYWMVGGNSYGGNSGTYYAPGIAYATSLTGTFTFKSFLSSRYRSFVTCIAYANGYWVIGMANSYSTTERAEIAYTTDPTGTWKEAELWRGSRGGSIEGIAYANGYWVVCGTCADSSDSYARIAYSTTLSGSWTTKDLWTISNGSSSTVIRSIVYANGYWAVGAYAYSYRDGVYYARIAYSTNLTGTWTMKDLWTNTDSFSGIYDLIYINDYWIACGQDRNGDAYYGRIAYSPEIAQLGQT